MGSPNRVRIALNICTYRRFRQLKHNIDMLLASEFFRKDGNPYYGGMEIFVVDNAAEIQKQTLVSGERDRYVHLFHQKNSGGSGGFQRGIEEIRRLDDTCEKDWKFTHVIFMDDDVSFEISCFTILYDFLAVVDMENADRPVAGRMLDINHPNIQWTAAEIWNGGRINSIEHLRDISGPDYVPGRVVYDSGAEYGGWWFCCFPVGFVRENDVIPFFLHCDDVEYGLRCGRSPIIIEGVQVWHEISNRRMSLPIMYYDYRNPLFVNERYGFLPDPEELRLSWKQKITEYHVKKDWKSEYIIIRAMRDYLRGWEWMYKANGEKIHQSLIKTKSSRLKNAIAWRLVEYQFKKKLL